MLQQFTVKTCEMKFVKLQNLAVHHIVSQPAGSLDSWTGIRISLTIQTCVCLYVHKGYTYFATHILCKWDRWRHRAEAEVGDVSLGWEIPDAREVQCSWWSLLLFGAQLSQAVFFLFSGEEPAVAVCLASAAGNPGARWSRDDVIVTSFCWGMPDTSLVESARAAAEARRGLSQSSAVSRNLIHRFFLLHHNDITSTPHHRQKN